MLLGVDIDPDDLFNFVLEDGITLIFPKQDGGMLAALLPREEEAA
jgi:hypothetical protein